MTTPLRPSLHEPWTRHWLTRQFSYFWARRKLHMSAFIVTRISSPLYFKVVGDIGSAFGFTGVPQQRIRKMWFIAPRVVVEMVVIYASCVIVIAACHYCNVITLLLCVNNPHILQLNVSALSFSIRLSSHAWCLSLSGSSPSHQVLNCSLLFPTLSISLPLFTNISYFPRFLPPPLFPSFSLPHTSPSLYPPSFPPSMRPFILSFAHLLLSIFTSFFLPPSP